ncbi:hypothetical protein PH05_25210 [Salmonella enterica]|nr:hypothetical protein [Salmonella enterica]ECO1727186.1 hypothetical protein [Salmonella enterica]ECO1736780.1 hypothetical protein [Salmonella enterica]ECO1759358.1 hypothetical protein [Salmonella enterica]
MAMHSGEIYQAQAARFSGRFAAGFTRQTPYSRRTRQGRCGQQMLCSIQVFRFLNSLLLCG